MQHSSYSTLSNQAFRIDCTFHVNTLTEIYDVFTPGPFTDSLRIFDLSECQHTWFVSEIILSMLHRPNPQSTSFTWFYGTGNHVEALIC